MSDKEFLERAAKAAGYVVTGWVAPGARKDGWWGLYLEGGDDAGDYIKWNPLESDGDAFRLAVKLKLACDEVWVIERTSIGEYECDPCAATRRAIVRAAAALWA